MIYIFFVVPVKMKWLAALQALSYIYLFAIGDWLTRLLLLASIVNYLLFFWRNMVARIRSGQRHMAAQAGRGKARREKAVPSLHGVRHYGSDESRDGFPLLHPMRRQPRLLHRAHPQP